MSRYYKLIDAIDTPTKINVAKRQNGSVRYGHINLTPGKKYVLEDDDMLIRSLRAARVQKRYSRELVETLDRCGVPYEEKACRSCGGSIKKVSYCVVEVHDGTEPDPGD